MLSVDVLSDQTVQSDLLSEIKAQTKNKVSQITVKPGKVLNRNISGGIFILSGFAVLYRNQGQEEKRVFLDRLGPGRLFFEQILDPAGHDGLELVAQSECQIAIANLSHLQQTNRVLNEKISQALFSELGLSCRGAMDQVCTLRNNSAKNRLIWRAQQVSQVLEPGANTNWLDIGMSSDLFLDMSGVSPRQFSRLLPELEKDSILKVDGGSVFVNLENIDAQKTI